MTLSVWRFYVIYFGVGICQEPGHHVREVSVNISFVYLNSGLVFISDHLNNVNENRENWWFFIRMLVVNFVFLSILRIFSKNSKKGGGEFLEWKLDRKIVKEIIIDWEALEQSFDPHDLFGCHEEYLFFFFWFAYLEFRKKNNEIDQQ